MTEIHRTTFIESRLDAYEAFFEPEWKWAFMQVIRDTKLQEVGFDLVRNWEAASNARALPWVMIKCLEVAERRKVEEFEPLETRKIRILRDRLVARMEAKGEKMRPMFRQKLQEAVNELDSEASEILEKVRQSTCQSLPDLWDVLTKAESFHSSLWNSERTCYGSIYYSYEWFLRECVRIKRGEPDYRMGRADDFKQDFKEAFGQSLTDLCWTDQQVNVARLTRHALVHNGGRITAQLQRQPHPFRIEGEELQFAASHTTALYHLLKKRAYRLTEEAAKMPEFQ
jgi:hypothetical protein